MADLLAALPPPEEWPIPRGRGACARDPKAGPGTCAAWWDGCPKAEKRGCYILWAKRRQEAMRQAAQAPQREARVP